LVRSTTKFLKHWTEGKKQSTAAIPISSVMEEYKVSKARLVVTLKDSKDEMIRKTGIYGRKWSASRAVQQAESRLRHKDIVGRWYNSSWTSRPWDNKHTKVVYSFCCRKRKMVQTEVRLLEEETPKARAVELGLQGAWTRWTTTERKVTWADLWQYKPLRLRFLLRSVYDLLLSPANFHRWGLVEDPRCPLCDKKGTMKHELLGVMLCKQAWQPRLSKMVTLAGLKLNFRLDRVVLIQNCEVVILLKQI
jgi:hypothetical protein